MLPITVLTTELSGNVLLLIVILLGPVVGAAAIISFKSFIKPPVDVS